MWDRLERVAPPATEAVTLEEAKAQCRVDSSDDDDLINRLIRLARDRMEGPEGIGVCLVSQQWRLPLDHFPAEIWIPMGPVLSVDSITYTDDAGDQQTLAADQYQWRKVRYGARITRAYNATWPTVRRVYDAVQVTFTAGFPGTGDSPVSTSNIPETLRHAMLLLIGHYYENREAIMAGVTPAELPLGFDNLVNLHRVGRF